jgi:DNA-binding CsgD family transcriptional regulator
MTFLMSVLLAIQLALPNVDVDNGIENWARKSGGNPAIMIPKGREIFEEGQLENDCQKILIGYGILLEAHNKSHGEASDSLPVLDTIQCPIQGVRIHRAEAIRHYDRGEFKEARHWFLCAFSAAETAKDLASLKQSIGMTYYMSYELDSAMFWLVESTKHGLDVLSSVSLSNLANVSYTQGKFEQCLKWGSLAEERLIEEFKEGIDAKEFQKRMDLVLINQVLAAMELRDFDSAQRTYGRMNLEDAFPGMAQEFFHAALQLSWVLDDPYPIDIHRKMYSEHLMKDSAAAVARFGPALCLLDPWHARWAQDQPSEANVWFALRKLPTEQLPNLTLISANADNADNNETQSMIILVLLNMAAFAGLGIWIWRRHRTKSQLRNVTDPKIMLQIVREALYQPNPGDNAIGWQAVLALSQTIPTKRRKSFPSNLTSREVEILYAAATQERPKTTAQRLGLSSKSIYMIRTDVRRKLKLAEGEKIEDWLTQMKEINHE